MDQKWTKMDQKCYNYGLEFDQKWTWNECDVNYVEMDQKWTRNGPEMV